MFSRPLPQLLRTAVRRPLLGSRCQNPLCLQQLPQPIFAQWPRSRHASTRTAARALLKENPVMFPLALVLILAGAGSLLYTSYIYVSYVAPLNDKFPEPVANKLRRALYYSNVDVNPQKALQYYKQALALADEAEMNPFSDEILGIKITLAAMLEKVGLHQKAIDVLEIIRADCRNWLEATAQEEGTATDRTRVLAKTVAISIKLGELYASEYIGDEDAAEKNLVQGVETLLKEEKRRQDDGVEPGDGPWMNSEEIGGALESLANHYEQQSKHTLSAPLYLRALTLSPPSCHAVVLMNNLSISLAQSFPQASTTAPTSRAALISNARAWAEKALSVAADIKPPERNEECDIGCAVAIHNLGEFAEMEGLIEDAKARYMESKSLSRAIGFIEGVIKAEEGMQRVTKAEGR